MLFATVVRNEEVQAARWEALDIAERYGITITAEDYDIIDKYKEPIEFVKTIRTLWDLRLDTPENRQELRNSVRAENMLNDVLDDVQEDISLSKHGFIV